MDSLAADDMFSFYPTHFYSVNPACYIINRTTRVIRTIVFLDLFTPYSPPSSVQNEGSSRIMFWNDRYPVSR